MTGVPLKELTKLKMGDNEEDSVYYEKSLESCTLHRLNKYQAFIKTTLIIYQVRFFLFLSHFYTNLDPCYFH